MADFDIAIIGGGINGAGIARDAAGRGLRVLLVEQNDLGSGTSAASSKLIHGGLRYLEYGRFGLVRQALIEREVLLRIAPHLVRPLRLVLPVNRGLRSPWLMRFGLFLYDRIGGREVLPPSVRVDLSKDAAGEPLKPEFKEGFEFSDCWVDDARLVVANVLDAAERGATVRTRARITHVERADVWHCTLDSEGRRARMTARILVNAAGPWIGQVAEHLLRLPEKLPLRLVKGSHIVVRRLFDHDRGYVLQNFDRRIVFALPFEGEYTLIGTTDREFSGEPSAVTTEPEEIDYLCAAVNAYFRPQIAPKDVVGVFAGVRALFDDGSSRPEKVTRDYRLILDQANGAAPALTVCGGKITTYRRLAEAALHKLSHHLPDAPSWTANAPLPGGDFAPNGLDGLLQSVRAQWPFLSEGLARRLVRAYGTRIHAVLGAAQAMSDLGQNFGADLTAAEVQYLIEHEWARSANDILWRRTKCGLHMNQMQREALGAYLAVPRVRAAAG
jgi:glycerol-3-phosphate dehydrogenase